MCSPSVRRYRTKARLDERKQKFGLYHPATFAAFARAFVAWDGVIRPPRHGYEEVKKKIPTIAPAEYGALVQQLNAAYTTANLRALGDRGYNNRSSR